MDDRTVAAQHRFPHRGQAIGQLAARDEEFRDLCIDFNDAEVEFLRRETSTDSKREERRAEYAELMLYLSGEIEAALDAAAVFPFRGKKPPTPT